MTTIEYTWRDSELRSRPIKALNQIGTRLGRMGITVGSLKADAVVAAATKAAGSSDLGSASYREPLEVYIRACHEEAELTPFGRIVVAKMLAAPLVNRIELNRWADEHREVLDEVIVSPWVIVGLPRTGTSLLSQLLGLDPMARPLLQWEGGHPIPPPTLEESGQDPRVAQMAKEIDGLMKLNPPLKAMHPFGATLAQECVSLFMYDLRTLALEIQVHVPTYARWLESADMAPAYAQHKLALQTLQSRQPTERWVLKTPNHLWQLDSLMATYPDARIIWTHRDPGPVVTSLASLANAGQRPFTTRADPRPTAEEWKRKCHLALDRATAFDQKADHDWCQHVHYDELVADPVGVVTRLYERFGETPRELHVRRMRAYLRDRPQDAFGRHRYDPVDFGWTYEGLAEEFASYVDRYRVGSDRPGAIG